MKRTMTMIYVTLLMLLVTAAVHSQTIHQSNTETVTKAYWTWLGRAPDEGGLKFWSHQMDIGDKNSASIDAAFKASIEYNGSVDHPKACVIDYTDRTDYDVIRERTPWELVTVVGKYERRTLVGTDVSPGTGTFSYGNVIIFKSGDCRYLLWVDFNKQGANLTEILGLLSMLDSSKSIQVQYDPTTGYATSVKILAFN